MSSILHDEDVYVNHHSHKRQIEPPEKDVGGCVGLLYQFSRATNLILHGLVFTVEHQRIYHNPTKGTRKSLKPLVLTGPSSPQTKAYVSMTTLRWDPLLAIDSSQSALSAEGGSGDKESFN